MRDSLGCSLIQQCPLNTELITASAVPSLIFFHEPFTLHKAVGIVLGFAIIYLVAGHRSLELEYQK